MQARSIGPSARRAEYLLMSSGSTRCQQVKDGDLQDPISPLGNESPRLQKPTLDLGDRQFNMRVTLRRPAEPRDSWDMDDDDVSVGAAAKSFKKTLSREKAASKKKGRTLLDRGNRGKVGHR